MIKTVRIRKKTSTWLGIGAILLLVLGGCLFQQSLEHGQRNVGKTALLSHGEDHAHGEDHVTRQNAEVYWYSSLTLLSLAAVFYVLRIVFGLWERKK